MEKVRFGVIGVGGMGSAHAKIIKELEETELTAVSDMDKETVDKVSKEDAVAGFTDYKKLIASGLVDAVIVATPHYFHPSIGVATMEAEIHCLCEKPIAVSVKGADLLLEAAKRTGKVFGVMYQSRSLPAIRVAREIIESGRLGKVRRTCMINPDYRCQAYYDSGTWRATWAGEGGGVLINQAPHGMDLFMLLGGMPSRVTARVRTRLHDIEVEDEADALLEYSNGAWGYYYVSTTEAPVKRMIEISGDNGKLILENETLKFYSLKTSIPEFTVKNAAMWGTPETVEEKLELPKCETGHGAITGNFARCILRGEKLLSPGEDGIKSVEFINALILSGKKNKPVDIPVDREEYEELLEGLKKSSKEKKVVKVQRVTDPRLTK
ncbi:MAG: Gfo/Idh/MocA family oxidoreductase [Candidatus Omnitrophica bacterium]|nr:Gfo/Idh/MocA family oxidoreductase [Candidatus Omnitrophota bacterium]